MFCDYCGVDLDITHSGQYDIDSHCKTKKHRNYVDAKKDAAGSQKLSTFFSVEQKSSGTTSDDLGVIRAQVMMTETLVKLNVLLASPKKTELTGECLKHSLMQ